MDTAKLRLEIEKIKKKLNNHEKNIGHVFQCLDEYAEKKEEILPGQMIRYEIPKKKQLQIEQNQG